MADVNLERPRDEQLYPSIQSATIDMIRRNPPTGQELMRKLHGIGLIGSHRTYL
jgi:hypothetical protein